MLERLAQPFRRRSDVRTPSFRNCLALGNTMIALARHRRYAYHSVGALGVIEMTAPTRAGYVDPGPSPPAACPPKKRHYFALHAVLDVKHSEAWNREALRPLVEEDPRRAQGHRRGCRHAALARRAHLRALPASSGLLRRPRAWRREEACASSASETIAISAPSICACRRKATRSRCTSPFRISHGTLAGLVDQDRLAGRTRLGSRRRRARASSSLRTSRDKRGAAPG